MLHSFFDFTMDSFFDNAPALRGDTSMQPARLGTEVGLDGRAIHRKDDQSLLESPSDPLPSERMDSPSIINAHFKTDGQSDSCPTADPHTKDRILCPSPVRSPSRHFSWLSDIDCSNLGGKPTLLSPVTTTSSKALPLSPKAAPPPATPTTSLHHHDIPRPLSPKISTLGWPSAFAENIFQHIGREQTGTPQTAMLFYDDIRVVESDVSIEIMGDGDPDAEFWASLEEPIARPSGPVMRRQTPFIEPPLIREPSPWPELVVHDSTPFVKQFKDREGDFLELIHEYSRWAQLTDTLPMSRWEVPTIDLPLIVVH
ncbi:hypothetical protein BDY17DRAFT_292909 [Neohortaea acidophila]|uniref:Uncharacterized protein n=1 Tax=Neohortaea acidophila TaxID=245834 RepID=A0A6A6PZA1_9PEZI|nr:uncharacterized protein BDY17DRAFT_292909 [Neohortaea acidophila]KAF2485089.1 hypothetical protein BDY17DRAFT_292909 [Neohortaea acidophila]